MWCLLGLCIQQYSPLQAFLLCTLIKTVSDLCNLYFAIYLFARCFCLVEFFLLDRLILADVFDDSADLLGRVMFLSKEGLVVTIPLVNK